MAIRSGIHGSGPGGQLTAYEVSAAEWVESFLSGELRGDGGQQVAASGGIAVHGDAVMAASGSLELRNPLAAELAREQPGVYANALKNGPPPSLWPGGDLPAYVAGGGIDPSQLLAIPWPARPAAARNPTRAYEMLEAYGRADDPNEIAMALSEFGDDPVVTNYRARFSRWRTAGMTDNQVGDSIFGPNDGRDLAPEPQANRFGTA
jgi:hypothetical protein